MANSKKQKKKEEVQNTSSSIEYTGSVTVKLVKDGKTVKSFRRHNTGCFSLFKFLVDCLAFQYSGNNCPKFLKCYHSSGTPTVANLGDNALIGGGAVSSTDAETEISNSSSIDVEGKVTYKFIIPSSMIDTSIVSGSSTINTLALYSTENVNVNNYPSAYLSLDTKNQIKDTDLGAGVSIIILWDLIFKNHTTQS